MVDSGPKCNLRADLAHTKRAEQYDAAMQRLQRLRDTKKRKDNIQEQHKVLSKQQVEEEDKSDEAGDEWVEPVMRTTCKVAAANKPAPSLPNLNVDKGMLKSQLIAKIAMCNQRANHFSFSLKELKMVWENGHVQSKSVPTEQPSKRIAGAFNNDKLQDLGTIEADNLGSLKGTKIWKDVVMVKPQGSCSASLHVVQSNIIAAIKWDVKSKEEEAECKQIAQDNTMYALGETSYDKDKPKKKGKSKSSNYKGPVWAILEATLNKVIAILLAWGFFNEANELNELIVCMWRFCATRIVDDPTLNCYSISVNKLQAVKYCITSWQGKLKDAIKPKVAGAYNLTGTSDEVKSTVDQLLDHNFHTQPSAEPSMGYYKHPFLQTACDAMVFSKRKGKPPIGAKFSKVFVQMPLPTIALLCAIIHFLLKMCCSGKEEQDNTIIREMVDPDAIDCIWMHMYQCGIKKVPVKPASAVKSEPKTGSHVLSIKDIVRSKPKSTRDQDDDVKGNKSGTDNGQIEHSNNKDRAKCKEKGKDKGADADADTDANREDTQDMHGNKDKDKDEEGSREIRVKSGLVPQAKQQIVNTNKGWDSGDDEEGEGEDQDSEDNEEGEATKEKPRVKAKAKGNDKGKVQAKAGAKLKEKETAKGKGKGKGKGVAQDKDPCENKGQTVPRAKKDDIRIPVLI